MESISAKQSQVQVRVNEFIRSVYNWMAIGLALTGFIAYYVASTPALLNLILGNRILFFGLIIAELRINRLTSDAMMIPIKPIIRNPPMEVRSRLVVQP